MVIVWLSGERMYPGCVRGTHAIYSDMHGGDNKTEHLLTAVTCSTRFILVLLVLLLVRILRVRVMHNGREYVPSRTTRTW